LFASGGAGAKRVVFLGTPDVAAKSLEMLAAASKTRNDFEVIAVVSQPPAPAGRNKKLTPSPVHKLAEELNLPLMTPESAKDEEFLSALEALQPDLCITAAYGNFLPKRFLAIPKLGTLNIHPSLLPKYRGAAPVQRCLEAGEEDSGVSVAETVLKMDAGPVVRQLTVKLSGDEKAPDFLMDMFVAGTEALLSALPDYFAGTATKAAQDETKACPAPKLTVEEARLDFSSLGAQTAHNRVRAFASWPGTWSTFSLAGGEGERVKIVTTVVLSAAPGSSAPTREVNLVKLPRPASSCLTAPVPSEALRVVCGDGSVLGVVELLPPGKKAMAARSFVNGLRGAALSWTEPPAPADSANEQQQQQQQQQ